jgi:hypothetical protein
MKITQSNLPSGLILLLAVFVSPSLFSQHKPKFFNQTDFTRGFGVGNIHFESIDFKEKNRGISFRMRTQFGLRRDNFYAFGVGFSLENYQKVDANTAPAFVEYKQFFSENFGQAYTYVVGGYSIPLAINMRKGEMGEMGIGSIIPLGKFKFTPSFGLNFQKVKDFPYRYFNLNTGYWNMREEDIILKTLKVNIGITF